MGKLIPPGKRRPEQPRVTSLLPAGAIFPGRGSLNAPHSSTTHRDLFFLLGAARPGGGGGILAAPAQAWPPLHEESPSQGHCPSGAETHTHSRKRKQDLQEGRSYCEAKASQQGWASSSKQVGSSEPHFR